MLSTVGVAGTRCSWARRRWCPLLGPQQDFLKEGRSQLGLEEFSQERMAG